MIVWMALCLAGGGDLLEPPPLYGGFPASQEKKEEDPGDPEDIFAIEAFALRTDFDEGLRIEPAWGMGADLKLGFGGPSRAWLRLGYAGWNTENDVDEIYASGVWVRQYRLGVGFEVPFRKLFDVGFWIDGGVYRFRRDEDEDTSPYVEFLGTIGVRPHPNVRIGLLLLSSHTQSSFNHDSTHLYHNYSAGPSVEVRF
jgi:hypothetical protein